MIGVRDIITLARAKLGAKRVLLVITIIVSGLLFGVLSAASIVASGVSSTVHDYLRTALGGVYLVKSSPVIPPEAYGITDGSPSDKMISELISMQKDYIARQKALAAKLKLPYNETEVQPALLPDPYADPTLPKSRQVKVNFESPVYQEYTQKLFRDYVAVAKNKLSDLQAIARRYGATRFSQNTTATVDYTDTQYIVDGREDLAKVGTNAKIHSGDFSLYSYMTASVRNSTYTFVDQSLIRRFILPANQKRQDNVTAIPVMITTTEATKLFGEQYGIPAKPKSADAQVAWIRNMQEKLNGSTYTACYRNAGETNRLIAITQAVAEAAAHKADRDYAAPSLAYDAPTTPCGDITVKRDTRTAAEKVDEQARTALERAMGTYQEPRHQLLTFVIVGILPVSPQGNALTSLPDFLSSILGAQYGAGAIIPRQAYDRLAVSDRHEDILINSQKLGSDDAAKAGLGETIVSFPSAKAARAFIADQGCPPYTDACKKLYTLEPYAASYLLADDIDSTAKNIMRLALPIALAIASIIIFATMARVIIDSRRETAVFRAIGAKRRDIMAIYVVYGLTVAAMIAGFSLALGSMIAIAIQIVYGKQATIFAQATFGLYDNVRDFSFIKLDIVQLGLIVVSIIGISLAAILPPLLRNVRRDPIKDMREE